MVCASIKPPTDRAWVQQQQCPRFGAHHLRIGVQERVARALWGADSRSEIVFYESDQTRTLEGLANVADPPPESIHAGLRHEYLIMRQEMEPVHLEQQLELRQRQLQEIAGTFGVGRVILCQRHTMTGRAQML